MRTTRRKFLAQLAGGSAVLSLGGTVPAFLNRAAAAGAAKQGDTVLVVVQLTGGNDGLNTVIPYRDDDYRKARPTLAIPAADVLKINDALGLHPAARGLADLLQRDQLAIIQGVGYPQPNRSHFESMDVWHTCRRKGTTRPTGWLGRYLDEAAAVTAVDLPALHIGPEKQPLALAAEAVRVPSLESLNSFRLRDKDDAPLQMAAAQEQQAAATADPLLGFLQSSTSTALRASNRITEALIGYDTPIEYPKTVLANRLKAVAQLIDAELGTRIYYVELDGFDTHSQQAAAHAVLLEQFAGAVKAFVDDLAHHGHADRTLVMSFSEFGRRVAENASQGTDHGAAAPMVLAGPRVRAGVLGVHPSLTDLDDGDLRFHTDFRQVYATLLDRWLGWPSRGILGDAFDALDLISA